MYGFDSTGKIFNLISLLLLLLLLLLLNLFYTIYCGNWTGSFYGSHAGIWTQLGQHRTEYGQRTLKGQSVFAME